MGVGSISGNITSLNAFNCNFFDGVDDFIEIPHNNAQLGANLTNGFTISAWINPRSRGEGTNQNSGRILDKSNGTTAATGWMFLVDTYDGNNTLFRLNVGTSKASAANSISFEKWNHAIVTVSSAQMCQHYINGVISGTAGNLVQPISAITTTNAMKIGNRSTATDKTFDGYIKDVKMWNRVLSQKEITEDYRGNVPTDGLIHYFKLGGDYADYGSVGVAASEISGCIAGLFETNLPPVISGSVLSDSISGSYLMCDLAGGQILSVGIEDLA